MPADQEFAIVIGQEGLNFRDDAAVVGLTGFTDAINWRLNERGAPTKRLGYQTYVDSGGTTTSLPANPLEMTTYSATGAAPQIVAYCDDGHVYVSPGDGTWTSIASGLSTSARPSFTVLDDILYWSNGTDDVQSWDGSSLTALTNQNMKQTITKVGSPTKGWWQITWNSESTQSIDSIQTISLTGGVAGGTATLSFGGHTTSAIAWNADWVTIQAALQALSSIGGNYLSVTGGPWPDPVVIEFTGIMGGQAQAAITGNAGSLTGGTPAVTIVQTQTGAGLTLTSNTAAIQAALDATFGIGSGNTTVTGGALGSTPVVIEFTGAYADSPQPIIQGSFDFDVGSISVSTTQKGTAAPPKGHYLASWRNRLWVANSDANPRRVWWSAIADPTVWQPTNFVDIHGPHDDPITAIIASPNIGVGFDGADGVLVYKETSLHRITDDSDNTLGVITGGANVLVDASNGTVNHRTVQVVNGRVYCVAKDGIYSTNGHTTQFLESARISRFFRESANRSQQDKMVAVGWQGSYLLGITSIAEDSNDLVLEVYTNLARASGDQQLPITAIDIPAACFAVYPATLFDILYFADSSDGQEAFVRRYGVGGTDVTDVTTAKTIIATARTGATTFNTVRPKRMRRIELSGHGQVQVGVASDFETGVGETNTFDMTVPTTQWGSFAWGGADWGSAGGTATETEWYERRGRYFALTLNDQTTTSSISSGALGVPGVEVGGSCIYAAFAAITPLSADT